jgi:hypothetical protein
MVLIMNGMTLSQAKKAFVGFTRWHNQRVPKEHRCKKAVLWQIYAEELMNTGNIELHSYETLSGHPEMWQ